MLSWQLTIQSMDLQCRYNNPHHISGNDNQLVNNQQQQVFAKINL
jgi:hypothetical protein